MASHDAAAVENKDKSLDRPKAPRRAKVACKACHARRVRCDVVQSHPCWHCRNRETVCEIMESRRGKYERTQRHRRQSGTSAAQCEPMAASNRELRPASHTSDSSQHEASGDDHRRLVSGDMDIDTSPSQIFTPDQDEVEVMSKHDQGPETLFARMADPEVTEQPHPQALGQDPSTLYLGEAFSLAFVVKTVCSPSNTPEEPKVHYPVPISAREARANERDAQSLLDNDVLALLQARGALTTPPKEVGDALVCTFFQSLHPAYPVFDRKDFEERYREGNMSLLALQTIYFLAATICDENLLQKTEFKSRGQARRIFYMRAKLLYDADYERDKTMLTAVLFLLGFWWQQPQDQKDTWHWLGCAISLAQTLGMHRTTVKSSMGPRTRSLWKRIWWSIYTRDRHAAAALGRPCRIRDEDCDVESLSETDLETDRDTTLSIIGQQKNYHVSYVINMSKLAVLLGQVLALRFSPLSKRNDDLITTVGTSLSRWEENLPHDMIRRPLRRDLDAAFWAANLHACYHNIEILLYRPTYIVATSGAEQDSTERAMYATDATTRIAEDLLTAGTLRAGQLHLIPALFAALGIHAIVIRQADQIRKKVAENRARQCMLALSELSKSWPVGGWILRLFQALMSRLTSRDFGCEAQRLLDSGGAHRMSAVTHPPPSGRLSPVLPPNLDNGCLGSWYTSTTDDPLGVASSVSNMGDENLYDFDLIFQHSLVNFAPLGFIDETTEFG